jgi:hypothetical protein
MKEPKSTSGAVIAGGYLLLTMAAASPLVQEGYIGHGNGLSFLLTIALTSPLSVILLLLHDYLFPDLNAGTGWPYFVVLCELGAGALLNAACSTCWTHSSGGSGTTRDSG